MRIRGIESTPYRLPLIHPWRDSHGQFTERKGWIIKLRTTELTGIGDCAPLPSVGTETYQQAANWLQHHSFRFNGIGSDDLLIYLDNQDDIPPAVRCGIETAAIDLLCKQNGHSISQWLNPEALDKVSVCANLGALENDIAAHLDQAHGCSVIKLKLGLNSLETELESLDRLCRRLPEGLTLRLDANQAWSFEEAEQLLDTCQTLPIESIEEPLHEPGINSLQRLQQRSQIPIAVDESLSQMSLEPFLDQPVVKRLTLKPMVLGGPRQCLKLARRAYDRGLGVVITTTVDSAIGVWMATHLAAALGPQSMEMAHGLATSAWLRENLYVPPVINNGFITL